MNTYLKSKRDKRYSRTKNGLVARIYNSQKTGSKSRGHSMPSYSKQELKDWLYSQHIFHDLYDLWVMSGFDKEQRPSVDRLDDYVGYEFGNIQVMTWRENRVKYYLDKVSGKNNKTALPVLQFDKYGNSVNRYHSISEASRITGTNKSNIAQCAKGKRTSAGGFVWKYN